MKTKFLTLAAIVIAITITGCKQSTSSETEKKVYSSPDGLILENDNVKVVFSKENGSMLCFLNKKTNWVIQKRQNLALSYKLLVPVSETRSNYIWGENQQLKKYEFSSDNKTLSLYWDSLQSDHGGLMNIKLKGTVTIADNGLTFNMEVENNSKSVIEAISWPTIGDLNPQSKETRMEVFHMGYENLGRNEIYPVFGNQKGYWGVDWPTQMYSTPDAPCILVASNTEGLYVGSHDSKSEEQVHYMFEMKPGVGIGGNGWGFFPDSSEAGKYVARIEMHLWHFSYVNPGEKRSITPIVLNPYIGSWHHGIDNYKEWRKTWFKAPTTPEWAKDLHSWLQLNINSPEEDYRCQFKDLPKVAEECAKHKISAIQLVGWNKGGQDRGNPLHDPDSKLGTWQDLKDAIAACEKLGVHIILFNKYTWADRSTDWFHNELIKYSVKDPYGDYFVQGGYSYQTPVQLAGVNTRKLIPMCQMSEKWREIAAKEFQKSIDLGASGMLYDETMHHGGGNYCFDKTHGHHVPACVYEGDGPLAEGFRKLTDKQKPDYLFAGEAPYDFQKNYYSLSYHRQSAEHLAGERYIDPKALHMIAAANFNDRVTINICLRCRYIISYEPFYFKGHPEDFPKTLEYGEKIDELRKKYREFLWDGEFRDTLGVEVMNGKERYDAYSVFISSKGNKRGVVILNNDYRNKEEQLTVSIPGAKELVIATPEKPEAVDFNGKIKIPAKCAVVIMEK